MYPIKQSTAITVPFFVHDAAGDGVASLTDGSFTKRISKNGGAFGAMTVTITELENGWYSIPLGTGHSDTTGLLSITFTNAGAKQVNLQFRVDARLPDDLAFPATTGRAVNVSAAGEVESDLQLWLGVAPLALSSQRVVSDVGAMQANVITAAAINAAAITNAKFANDAIDAGVVADNFITAAKINAAAITAAKFGADAITAGVIATGAIDADAVAADAVTKIRSLISGTSDSGGSTTTMVDAALSEADDLWTGNWVLFTSGANANQCRLITDFDAASDTITFVPAVAASVGAGFTYEILPYGGADVQSWIGLNSTMVSPNALVSGRVDASVGAMAANVLTASALATDAVDELADAIWNEDIAAAHGTADTAGLLLRALGALIAARSNNATLNALLGIGDSAGNDLPNELREAPQKNVALDDIEFLMVASADHVAPLTGLSPVATRSIDGGAFAATTGSVAEVGNGIYQFDASMADMNGDIITFRFAVATADDTFLTIKTKD